MDPREQQRRIVLSRGESVEGTIDSMRKESSVQQFITIREMERRESQVHEEKKARIIESKNTDRIEPTRQPTGSTVQGHLTMGDVGVRG